MTKKELIEKLKDVPDDMEVFLCRYGEFDPAKKVEIKNTYKHNVLHITQVVVID